MTACMPLPRSAAGDCRRPPPATAHWLQRPAVTPGAGARRRRSTADDAAAPRRRVRPAGCQHRGRARASLDGACPRRQVVLLRAPSGRRVRRPRCVTPFPPLFSGSVCRSPAMPPLRPLRRLVPAGVHFQQGRNDGRGLHRHRRQQEPLPRRALHREGHRCHLRPHLQDRLPRQESAHSRPPAAHHALVSRDLSDRSRAVTVLTGTGALPSDLTVTFDPAKDTLELEVDSEVSDFPPLHVYVYSILLQFCSLISSTFPSFARVWTPQ